jgi:hypothetical protein
MKYTKKKKKKCIKEDSNRYYIYKYQKILLTQTQLIILYSY